MVLKSVIILLAIISIALSARAQQGAPATNHGALNILIEDEPTTVYLVSVANNTFDQPNITISEDSNSFTFNGGGRVEVTTKPTDFYQPDIFFNFTLLGKELSYTVDRNQVGCSCNSALYFAALPGYNADQDLNLSDQGTYYCDANKVFGNYCPEMDVSEANRYTLQTTPHKCSKPDGKYYSSCDRSGCMANVWFKNPWAMCPESSCTIDTRKPYTHTTAFEKSEDGKLTAIKNTLIQGSQNFTFDACSSDDYLEEMTDHLAADMAMIFQSWGNSWWLMSWLDFMTLCLGSCKLEETVAIFSDIKIKSL